MRSKWLVYISIFFVYVMTCYAAGPNPVANVEYEDVHYVTLKFTQSSFTLSIRQHIKDAANAFSITLPTTKKFYDSVKEGQELKSNFKTATFLLSRHIGSRKVIVEKKFIKREKK